MRWWMSLLCVALLQAHAATAAYSDGAGPSRPLDDTALAGELPGESFAPLSSRSLREFVSRVATWTHPEHGPQASRAELDLLLAARGALLELLARGDRPLESHSQMVLVLAAIVDLALGAEPTPEARCRRRAQESMSQWQQVADAAVMELNHSRDFVLQRVPRHGRTLEASARVARLACEPSQSVKLFDRLAMAGEVTPALSREQLEAASALAEPVFESTAERVLGRFPDLALFVERMRGTRAALASSELFVQAVGDAPLAPGRLERVVSALAQHGQSAEAITLLKRLVDSGRLAAHHSTVVSAMGIVALEPALWRLGLELQESSSEGEASSRALRRLGAALFEDVPLERRQGEGCDDVEAVWLWRTGHRLLAAGTREGESVSTGVEALVEGALERCPHGQSVHRASALLYVAAGETGRAFAVIRELSQRTTAQLGQGLGTLAAGLGVAWAARSGEREALEFAAQQVERLASRPELFERDPLRASRARTARLYYPLALRWIAATMARDTQAYVELAQEARRVGARGVSPFELSLVAMNTFVDFVGVDEDLRAEGVTELRRVKSTRGHGELAAAALAMLEREPELAYGFAQRALEQGTTPRLLLAAHKWAMQASQRLGRRSDFVHHLRSAVALWPSAEEANGPSSLELLGVELDARLRLDWSPTGVPVPRFELWTGVIPLIVDGRLDRSRAQQLLERIEAPPMPGASSTK